jgi:ribose 5-phosphate isomerase A
VSLDELKRQAAARAVEFVRSGMKLGLGTGSTAKHFVELLGERVRDGLDVIGVPTSEATRDDAIRCGIRLTTLDEIDRLDITVDGADEIDPSLNLIKGGGGALLREKIVAAASDRMIVIADDSKWVETLGRFPLPIEVIPFGLAATRHAIEKAFANCAVSGKAVTVTFLSPMVATGSWTRISDVSPMRRVLPNRLAPFRVSSSMGYSSASPAPRCWPAPREFVLLSGASGVDLAFAINLAAISESECQILNSTRNLIFPGDPLILTFAKGLLGTGSEC